MNPDQELLIRLAEKSDKIIDSAMKVGVAYMGYKAANHWTGSLNALIALKLAQSGNIVAGAAGVGVLAFIGATQIVQAPPENYYDVRTSTYR